MDPTLTNCEEYQKMIRGELYYSFGPELSAARRRCALACRRFNAAEDPTRRQVVQMWRDVVGSKEPMPPPASTPEEDDKLFVGEPWVEAPIRVDYGIHLSVGAGTYINFNFLALDTCQITIGARVLFGPNVSLYSASHPLDPAVRKGIEGPECGEEIHIEDDCWIGGNVVVLPGVTIGKGAIVGAGAIVTKSVEPFTIVGGNPARFIKRLEKTL